MLGGQGRDRGTVVVTRYLCLADRTGIGGQWG